ncbi:GNAT family N-acetyltransferase [Streptomyces sp. NPDC047130]|uniref:GNAT family N-acetyltransferase n=1 Tax=Streptomyces sp. NPDC047130 TaxID=3155261 RepID=UPI00340FAC2D
MGADGEAVRVRQAAPEDLPQVVGLVIEHAAYEQAAPPPADLAARLEALLFGTATPRLRCFVAVLPGEEIVGYASCAPEVSTWDGEEYLHLDCLFLRDGRRGLGAGRSLMDAVVGHARELGLRQVQWQTPAWNARAIRFYDRLGAPAREKRRFTLTVD